MLGVAQLKREDVPMANKICPACSGAGETSTGFGAFKFRGVCKVCHGNCYVPDDHPIFTAAAVASPVTAPPSES